MTSHSPSPYPILLCIAITLILDIHAPLKKKRMRPDSAPWTSPEIRKPMKQIDKSTKDVIYSPDLLNDPSQAYTTFYNKLTTAIRDTLQACFLGLISENKEIQNVCGRL